MEGNEEKIVFHDEDDANVEKKTTSKKAIYAFGCTMVYLVCELIINVIRPFDNLLVFGIVAFITFFASIILGIMALKEIKKKVLSGKSFAVMGIVLPFVIFILANIAFMVLHGDEAISDISTIIKCAEATECVDNGDGSSTCQYEGKDFKCETEILEESQYKEK